MKGTYQILLVHLVKLGATGLALRFSSSSIDQFHEKRRQTWFCLFSSDVLSHALTRAKLATRGFPSLCKAAFLSRTSVKCVKLRLFVLDYRYAIDKSLRIDCVLVDSIIHNLSMVFFHVLRIFSLMEPIKTFPP